jgi:hypothetical protein
MVKRCLLLLLLVSTAVAQQDPADSQFKSNAFDMSRLKLNELGYFAWIQDPPNKPPDSQNTTPDGERQVYPERTPGETTRQGINELVLNELGYFTTNKNVKIQPKVVCSVPLLRIDGDKNAKVQRSTPRNVDPKMVIAPNEPTCAAWSVSPVEEIRLNVTPDKK